MTSLRADLGALLDRAAVGDLDAFATFYDLTVERAYTLARLTAADPGSAEAAVLDAYAGVWEGAGEHRLSGLSPLAWLLRRVTWSGAVLRAA